MARTEEAAYLVNVRDGGFVGPHSAADLQRWVELGIIRRDWFVCREGESAWMPIEEIPQFDRETVALVSYRKYLSDKRRSGERWWNDSITEKQRQLISYFEIPIDLDPLNKGEASLFIEALSELDPSRKEKYDSEPCSESQVMRIRELGGTSTDLTRREARREIEALEFDQRERSASEFEEEVDLMLLEQSVNSEEVKEVCDYGGIASTAIADFKKWMDRYHEDWRSLGNYDLGAIAKRWERKEEKRFLASDVFQRGLDRTEVLGRVKCPKCGCETEVSLGDLLEAPKVHCSQCHVTLNLGNVEEHVAKYRKFEESRIRLKEKLPALKHYRRK